MGFTPYTIQYNEFLSTIMNKLGRTIWSSKAYLNPLKEFKKGFIENANDIEEIYVARLEGQVQDFEGANPLTRVKPDVSVYYHRQNYGKLYHTTVTDQQVRRAFTTANGVKRMADEIMQSLHTGAEYDEYVAFRDSLSTLIAGVPQTGKVVAGPVTDETSAKAFVKAVKKVIGEMKFRNEKYSVKESNANIEDLMLIVTPSTLAEIDVELLATTFNVDKLRMLGKVVEVDSLPAGVNGIILDRGAIQIYDTLYNHETQRNAKGMFTNHFLNVEKIISYSNLYPVAVLQTSVGE